MESEKLPSGSAPAGPPAPGKRPAWLMVVGLLVLAGLVAVTLLVPVPRPAYLTLMVLKAAAAAMIADGLTGRLDISGKVGAWAVKAGGPMAVALVVGWADYRLVPPEPVAIVAGPPAPATPDGGAQAHRAGDAAALAQGADAGAAPGRTNSPTIEKVAGSVDFETGDVKGKPPAGTDINSGTIRDIGGSVRVKHGNVDHSDAAPVPASRVKRKPSP